MYRWLLAFHVIFIVSWFAGLFYLPRLFVYHADCHDDIGNHRFKIMERRLFYGIMTPAGVLTILFGVWILMLNAPYYFAQAWIHAKLTLVCLLIIYHIFCGIYVAQFKADRNRHKAFFYRLFNEIPTVLLVAIVILAIVKPIW